jgi:superfamily II DNA helicase RecQ
MLKLYTIFRQVPVMALTATATPRVRTDILYQVCSCTVDNVCTLVLVL